MKNYPISIREQLLQAVLKTLTPIAKEMKATLFRSPTVAVERDQTPAIIVFPDEEQPEHQNSIVVRRLTIRIVALAREVDGNVAEVVADQLIVAAHRALMANSNLDGLCIKVREVGTEWDMEDADGAAVAIPARYEIEYRTHLNDLTQKA